MLQRSFYSLYPITNFLQLIFVLDDVGKTPPSDTGEINKQLQVMLKIIM